MTDAPALPFDQEAQAEMMSLITVGDALYTRSEYREYLQEQWSNHVVEADRVNSDPQAAEAFSASVTANACAQYRADTMAAIPVAVMDAAGDIAEWHPFSIFVQHSQTLLWHTMISLCIWGKAYLLKQRNDFGFPTGLEWINPLRMRPVFGGQGAMGVQQVIGYWLDNEPMMRPVEDVIFIPFFDPQNPTDGLSYLEILSRRISTEVNLMTFASRFFLNMARPDGMLTSKIPPTTDQLKEARAQWKAFKSAGNAHKTFVSSGEWTWQPITPAPTDLAMTELSSEIRKDICVIFRVNPLLIGAAGSSDPLSAQSTFASVERNHLQAVAVPTINFILGEMTRQWAAVDFVPADYFVLVADTSKVPALSNATKERTEIAQALLTREGPIGDYAEAREMLGLPIRDGYFLRPIGEALELWSGSVLTLNQTLGYVGAPKLMRNGDVMMIGGVLLPVARLMEIANANAEALIHPPPAVSPFQLPSGGGSPGNKALAPMPPVSQPPLLAEPQPPAEEQPSPPEQPDPQPTILREASVGTSPSAYTLLTLYGDPGLTTFQQGLMALLPNSDGVRWVPASDFHVTLTYGTLVSDQQVQDLFNESSTFATPSKPILCGPLSVFDQGDQKVLILLVEVPDEYRQLQSDLYDRWQQAGVPMSEFSDPAAWQPHITLAYLTADIEVPALQDLITAAPQMLLFSRGDFRTIGQIPLESNPEPPTMLSLPVRAAPTARMMTLSIGLGDNQFIRYARRELATSLSQAGVPARAMTWDRESDWRLPLAGASDVPYADALRALDGIAFNGVRAQFYTSGYALRDGALCLMIADTPELQRLRAEALLNLKAMGYDAAEVFDPFIPLGWLGETGLARVEIEPSHPDSGYPLVAGQVGLYMDAQPVYSWPLRHASPETLRELGNWRKKVGQRGAAVAFETELLTAQVAGQVRACLDAALDPDQVFDIARDALVSGSFRALDNLTPAPGEYDLYWNRFDQLQADLGAAWVAQMATLMDEVRKATLTKTKAAAFNPIKGLAAIEQPLADAWIGTEESPGPMLQLVLAGMASATEAVERNRPAKPKRDDGLEMSIDWKLLNQEAYDFARQYAYSLIRGINETTANQVGKIVADWIESGQPLRALRDALMELYKSPVRAEMIAQTESIRVFNEGAFKRWENVGVSRGTWQTVRDGDVCPICKRLHGQEADIAVGWTDPQTGLVYRASAHPLCRCFRRPVVA